MKVIAALCMFGSMTEFVCGAPSQGIILLGGGLLLVGVSVWRAWR